jgi:hypothetical protein
MLRPIDPSEAPPPAAYRVPWVIQRNDPRHPVVTNGSAESADFVRVFLGDSEHTLLWGQVLPAEDIELCLCAVDLDDAVVTLAWFRPTDGLEYVWRFVA